MTVYGKSFHGGALALTAGQWDRAVYRVGFDSVTAANLPPKAEWVFAYVCGAYANVDAVRARCPHARLVTICVDAKHVADMLDVERYDAKPVDVPRWSTWMRSLGRRPVAYTSRTEIGSVEQACAAVDVPPPFIAAADFTNKAHMVSGSVGTQWADGTPAYPGLAPGCDTWLISSNWPDRFQHTKGKPMLNVSATQAGRLIRQTLAAAGIGVPVIGSAAGLQTGIKGIVGLIGGILLYLVDQHHASKKVNTATPPAA